MTPAAVQRLIEARGETVTLRREGAPAVDVSVKARVRGYNAGELVGEIQQGDREAVIGNAEIAAAAWPGPPKKGDRLILAGNRFFTVTGCDTRKLGDDIAGHWLVIRGT